MYKILFVAGAALLLASGCEDSKITTLTNENETLKEEILQLKKVGCDVCTTPQTNAVFTMTPSTLTAMRAQFKNSAAYAATDANSIWFPLDDIKNFILTIQKDTCGKNCNDTLGIRIYYARYPQQIDPVANPDLAGLPPTYVNKHTLFMVPTYNINGEHIDFNPLDTNAKGCKKTLINPDASNIAIRAFSAKNHGELCPPVCPPTGYAAFGY